MTKKMTKKEMFAMVVNVIENSEVENKVEMLDFITHEINLLEKKNSKSTPTKNQKENEFLMAQLLTALAEFDRPITVTEFMKESPSAVATLSNQKLSALLKKLVDAQKVVKSTEKKKSYFSLT